MADAADDNPPVARHYSTIASFVWVARRFGSSKMFHQAVSLRGKILGQVTRSRPVFLASSFSPATTGRLLLPKQPVTTDASVGLLYRNPALNTSWSRSTNLVPEGNLLVQNIHKTAQNVQTSLSDIFRQAVWQMSSTLKKRRAKMNKHKLRKRRKLERRKSK